LYVRFAVKFTWDETKRFANLEKHGLDFGAIDDAFFENAVIISAKFGRLQAIGALSGITIVANAIFLLLGTEGISIISLRLANRKERKLLDDKAH